MKTNETNLLMIGNFFSYQQGSYSVGEGLAQVLSSHGLRVHLTSRHKNKFLRLLDMLFTVWRLRTQVDLALIEVFSGPAFFWAEACCQLLAWLNTPYILTLHGGNLPAFSKKYPHRVQRLLNSATAVTAPSPYLQQSLNAFRPNILWIPNPIALKNYNFKPRINPEAQLVWLRAFHRIYHPSLAVQVLALILPDFPSANLLMVGPDKGDGSLQETRRLANELGVQEHLEIYGAVPKQEVPHLLSSGDIFLNTTRFDNTPVSVLEAMACGLGVISTNVGGIPYLLEHEVDSLLVPLDNADAMAKAVQRLLSEPDLASKLSAAARRKVEKFDWEFILPQWLDLIHQTISQPTQSL